MNPSKESSDVFAILAVAQANWPHDPVAGSEAVWKKWRELLGSFRFDEVRTALDAMARTHPRLPPLSELQGELRARRLAALAHEAEETGQRQLEGFGQRRYPPVCLDADYVIGPYSAAFSAMNVEGWTTERLIECIRIVDPDSRTETATVGGVCDNRREQGSASISIAESV
jgi:hypothetical protein